MGTYRELAAEPSEVRLTPESGAPPVEARLERRSRPRSLDHREKGLEGVGRGQHADDRVAVAHGQAADLALEKQTRRRGDRHLGRRGHGTFGHDPADGLREQVGGKVPGEQAPKVPIRDDTDQAGAASSGLTCYSALIGIVDPLAAGVFGSVIVSTPFLNAAVTFPLWIATGSLTARVNAP